MYAMQKSKYQKFIRNIPVILLNKFLAVEQIKPYSELFEYVNFIPAGMNRVSFVAGEEKTETHPSTHTVEFIRESVDIIIARGSIDLGVCAHRLSLAIRSLNRNKMNCIGTD